MKTYPQLLFLLCLLFTACEVDLPPLELQQGVVENEFHKKHIGKIAFMQTAVPMKELTDKNFSNTIVYTEDAEFNVRLLLKRTLTSYLHDLEPELSVRELCDNGNYQPTFYVDGKKHYTYNLQTGAGSCEFRNEATTIRIPFKDKDVEDHWGRFLWLKFMKKEGGYDALSNGPHELKIEIRPYIEHTKLKVGDIIAQGSTTFQMSEIEVAPERIAVQVIQPTDKWPIATTPIASEPIEAINKKIAQKYFKDITSIVVVKNGELMLEEYFGGANRSTLHDTRSVGKSFASTITVIAIAEKHIKSENSTLSEFYDLKKFANFSKEKEQISIKNLLTMQTGLQANDIDQASPGQEEKMYPTSDWAKFTLDLPMDETKKAGKDWQYTSAGAALLGDILHQKVPGGLEKYAKEKLLDPLGITDFKWQYTPTKVANTAGGFQLSSLDLAKFGSLYLDNSILSQQWIDESFSKHATVPQEDGIHYGYFFWNKTYHVNGKDYEAYSANGNGGNKVMIFKDLNAVVVITATAYGKAYGHQQAEEIIEKYILPAITKKPSALKTN